MSSRSFSAKKISDLNQDEGYAHKTEAVGMMKSLIEMFKGKRIAVIGDIMLDRFIWGDVNRISPEAPVPVVHVRNETYAPGGAGNTAANVASLGGTPLLIGLAGRDTAGDILLSQLKKHNIDTKNILQIKGLKTTEKIRIVGLGQQLARIDYEQGIRPDKKTTDTLLARFRQMLKSLDAVIISDYTKGAVSRRLATNIISLCIKNKKPVIADPKPASIGFYKSATLVTPNSSEATKITGIVGGTDSAVKKKAGSISKALGTNVLITRGKKGMLLFNKDGTAASFQTRAREVYDVSGAGDTVVAVLGLCLASGTGLEKACMLANYAAGIAVGKLGTSSVSLTEMASVINKTNLKTRSIDELNAIVRRLRQNNRKVVWTNGCFDLLHVGHIRYLREAKSLGDVLIIGVNSDSSVRKLKGKKRPIISEKERTEILSSLEFVDYLLIYDDETATRFLKELRPDFFVKGGDYTMESLDKGERKAVESYGGKIVLIPPIRDRSTTNVIKRILDTHSKE